MQLVFLRDNLAAFGRFLLGDGSSAKIGIDAHLFPRHRVQGEPGSNLGHPLGSLCDHNELDDRDDQKDDYPDDKIPPDHKVSKGVDDLTGVRLEQDHPSRGDVQGESEQGRDQQKGGETRKSQNAGHVK